MFVTHINKGGKMKYFTFKEMITTDTGLPNIPNWGQIHNLETLITKVLDPVRELYGKPIKVNSGFRSKEVNAKIGGAKNSHHMLGTCADITGGSVEANKQIFELIKKNCMWRQLINEYNFKWIHVEYKENDNKLQILDVK